MPETSVRRVAPDQWLVYREVRLAALADSPSAFSTTLAEATEVTEEGWRRRLTDGACFIASADGPPVGLAAGFAEDDAAAELISMWVAPPWRGRGVADQLVAAVAAWAGDAGFVQLRLWVADGNDRAERLYARNGFARTGVVQPVHEHDPARLEFQMTRALAGSAG
jgi:GNAT superfamily N-acetyltransferase